MESAVPDNWIESCRQAPDDAWDTFLAQYHAHVMAVVKKMVRDQENVMEAYTYALDQLRHNECQKLTRYDTKPRPYNFETWIIIVVQKCCLDWFRRQKSYRLPACIQALPEDAQWIFRYIYWYRYSYQTVYQLLTSDHGCKLLFDEMMAQVHEITEALRQHTRGQLFVNWQATLPPILLESPQGTSHKSADPESLEDQLSARDSARILREIIDSLSGEQQLLIQLHFYRGLTYKEMADVLNIQSLWRVRWKLEKTLKLLKKKLRQKGIGADDLEFL